MIAFLRGTVNSITENSFIIDCNNIGYEINASVNTLNQLSQGDEILVLTYMAVKEDGISLYGFLEKEEKELFLQIITVSGIGPKLALGILSGLSFKSLESAIATGDIKLISSIKGVGKKTAERLVLELKDKITVHGIIEADVSEPIPKDMYDEAMEVLHNLGFTKAEASKALSKVTESYSDTSELLSLALRSFDK